MDLNNTSPNRESYKYCFVPSCRNTTYSTPEKHFIFVPKNDEVRKQWCIAANCPGRRLRTVSYCCEDHFDLKEDLENYFYVKTVPNARKIIKKGVVPRFFNAACISTTSKNTNFTELMIKNETLDDNVSMEVGLIKNEIPEDGSNDLMKEEILSNSIKTEVIIKNEILNDNIVMEVERIKNEIPEGNSDVDNVISVKHESVDENDKHLYSINYENIKLEKELHTELIINDKILDEKFILESQGIYTGSTNQSFVSDTRNKTFTKKQNLVRHRQSNSGEKPISCHVCNKRFNRQSDLVKHKLIHSGEKPFSCDICNKTFNRQSSLVEHKRIHSGEKPFPCDICNIRFTNQRSLVEHKRLHSIVKPFSCDICNKRFTNQRSLVEHKLMHRGENPFSCDICNKRFTRQGSLVEHKRIHSGEKLLSCNICNQTFTYRRNLVKHERIHNDI